MKRHFHKNLRTVKNFFLMFVCFPERYGQNYDAHSNEKTSKIEKFHKKSSKTTNVDFHKNSIDRSIHMFLKYFVSKWLRNISIFEKNMKFWKLKKNFSKNKKKKKDKHICFGNWLYDHFSVNYCRNGHTINFQNR